jgi:hypothetical protein
MPSAIAGVTPGIRHQGFMDAAPVAAAACRYGDARS